MGVCVIVQLLQTRRTNIASLEVHAGSVFAAILVSGATMRWNRRGAFLLVALREGPQPCMEHVQLKAGIWLQGHDGGDGQGSIGPSPRLGATSSSAPASVALCLGCPFTL